MNYLIIFVTIVAFCTLTIWLKSSTNPDIYIETRVDGEHAISVTSLLTSKQNGQPRYKAKHVRKGCIPNMTHAIYYSPSREDYALFKNYFNSPPIYGGVYVEIGPLDGVRHSNTKFFQDQLNWTGVGPSGQRSTAGEEPPGQPEYHLRWSRVRWTPDSRELHGEGGRRRYPVSDDRATHQELLQGRTAVYHPGPMSSHGDDAEEGWYQRCWRVCGGRRGGRTHCSGDGGLDDTRQGVYHRDATWWARPESQRPPK